MKESIKHKLETLIERQEEIAGLLAEPEIMADQNKFRELSKEYAQLGPVVSNFTAYKESLVAIEDAKEMLKEKDKEIQEMAKEELAIAKKDEQNLALTLQKLLLPKDANDQRNVFLEIRAGAGGDEAALFAGDLYRMYTRYAESRRWQIELINGQEAEQGGYKEVIIKKD